MDKTERNIIVLTTIIVIYSVAYFFGTSNSDGGVYGVVFVPVLVFVVFFWFVIRKIRRKLK